MLSDRIIYGLTDPRTGLIRYIGRSKRGILRAKQHATPSRLACDHTHKGNWIRQLRQENLGYGIAVLEEGVTDLTVREKYWISYGRDSGWPLTNLTEGGECGPDGKHFTPEHRAKISAANRGRRLTHEQRQKLSTVARGRQPDPERLEAMRAAWSGRHHTEETKRQIGIGQVGRILTREGRERIRAANSRSIMDTSTGIRYVSQKEAAAKLGLCVRSISRVLKGQFQQTGGRTFVYAS